MSEELSQEQLNQQGKSKRTGTYKRLYAKTIETYGEVVLKQTVMPKVLGSQWRCSQNGLESKIKAQKGGEDVAYGMSAKDGGDPSNSILKPLKERVA